MDILWGLQVDRCQCGRSINLGRHRSMTQNSIPQNWYISVEPFAHYGSGLSTYLRHVALAAQEMQRAITIFFPTSENELREEVDGYVRYVHVPNAITPKYDGLGYWMHLSWKMAQVIEAEIAANGKPASIEIPDGFAIGYFLLQNKLTGSVYLENVPLLVVAHTPIGMIDDWQGKDLYRLPLWWIYQAEKWCFKAADAVITLSDMMETSLRDEGYLTSDQVVRRALNPYVRKRSPHVREATSDGVRCIGMGSRMIFWKGLREAANLMQTPGSEGYTLHLCGASSDDLDLLRSTSHKAQFKEQKIVYKGLLHGEDMFTQRAQWLCQIHPSHKDNFPYAVLEALYAGVPCYIAAQNGVAEILPAPLREALVIDFSKPEDAMRAISKTAEIAHLLKSIDWSLLSADRYFSERDSLLEDLRATSKERTQFPFIWDTHAKSGLPDQSPIRDGKLTVVIPYYNMADYIDETIKSVLESTVQADIVLVNDGSPNPDHVAFLDRYRNMKHIRVYDIPNGGVANARNYGVAQAKTEFVALLDADDTVEPTYYEQTLNVLGRYHNVAFVGAWCNDFEDDTGETRRFWPTYNAEPLPNMVINQTNCQSMIYRTALYQEAGQHDPALKMYLDDWDGVLSMLNAGYYGVMLPAPLFNYRQREGSTFSSGRSLWYNNYRYIIQKQTNLTRQFGGEAMLLLNSNGSNSDFHLLGWETPMNTPAPNPTQNTKRLKHPYLLMRSIAKRLDRWAHKGG